MSQIRFALPCAYMLSLLPLFAAADTEPGRMVHQVRKGETISLICIDYYGKYTPDMGSALQEINSTIQDINLIYPGQKISLPDSAVKAPAQKKTAAHATSVIFEKNVAATQGVVTYVEGTATLRAAEAEATRALTANTIVSPGDIIETGAHGRVEIIINRESVVRMRENTRLHIDRFRDLAAEEGKTSLTFPGGALWTKVKRFSDKLSRFQLELPTAIAGVHGTVYETRVAPDQSAEVKVFSGEVAVSGGRNDEAVNPGNADANGRAETAGPAEVAGPHEVSIEEWTQIVRSMQRIRIDPTGAAAEPETFQRAPDDDWERWNEERDKRIAQMFGEAQ